jgi:adenosylhomocysteine nucleosidase
MAADAEYGPHLKARITPLMTGVGPVEASRAADAGALPPGSGSTAAGDFVVSLGSAGSATLEQTGVYQASARFPIATWTPRHFGFDQGRHALPRSSGGGDAPRSHSRHPGGDAFRPAPTIVSGPAYQGIDADMVEMETYA